MDNNNNHELMKLFHRTIALTRRHHKPEEPPHRHPGPGDVPPYRPPHRPPHHPPYQGHILMLLKNNQGVSQAKLALLAGIRPQSLSEALSKLENEGMIERRANPGDKRETLVFLTELAVQRMQEIEKARIAFADEFFAPLSVADRKELGRLLLLLCDAHSETPDSAE